MTDRIRFMENAKANGCEIKDITDTSYVVVATNGKMETTYNFDDNGYFLSTEHKFF